VPFLPVLLAETIAGILFSGNARIGFRLAGAKLALFPFLLKVWVSF